MGAMKTETLGMITFEDKKNFLKSEITIGKVKKKPSDYFQGTITVKGQIAS